MFIRRFLKGKAYVEGRFYLTLQWEKRIPTGKMLLSGSSRTRFCDFQFQFACLSCQHLMWCGERGTKSQHFSSCTVEENRVSRSCLFPWCAEIAGKLSGSYWSKGVAYDIFAGVKSISSAAVYLYILCDQNPKPSYV